MGKEKTGRPSDIDAWRQRQYLDLQQRKLHIPASSITWDMLTDDVKRLLTLLPVGRYGTSTYGLCSYGTEFGLYGTAKYGAVAYGSYTPLTGKFDGTGGYGSVKYG